MLFLCFGVGMGLPNLDYNGFVGHYGGIRADQPSVVTRLSLSMSILGY